ncbi:MAG TPA: glycosyltransferase family 2 protein [Candidatus Acidoferrum sp.]|nr:glycosyltransferase family 2 protein [Candidatus Acidoferrum sp.]
MTANSGLIIEATFWTSAAFLLYDYGGYPILLALLTRFSSRRESLATSLELPAVTLLISAYNESLVMEEKLKNSLAIDYPRDRLEVMVVSDCSDDGTDDLVRSHAQSGVRLVRQRERLGKTAGLNLAVPMAGGEILVFSDANAIYRNDAIRQLVRHFSDSRVGYVVGNARYVENASDTEAAEAEGLYWKLETWLKQKESAFESVVGGDGAIYAIRRELYTPLLPTDINDFLNPLQIIDRGYRGIFDPAAVSYEETAKSFDKEFRRKVRIVSRSFNALGRIPGVLNPLRNPRHWFLLISHKLLRWLAPFFMIIALATSLLLWFSPFYRVAVLLQGAFYASATAGWLLPRVRAAWKPFSLAYYFCLVNLASLIGCVKCWRGDLSATWTPPRQSVRSKA